MAFEKGYVETLWGRKRRLPDMRLPEYEFDFTNFELDDFDPLSFDSSSSIDAREEAENKAMDKYVKLLHKAWGKKAKDEIKAQAKEEGIKIIDNGGYIADAERQCVNSRVQGSASDMSKKAMILIGNDKQLKELGFKLLIPVHDELIAQCPIENVKICKERFAYLMSIAAKDKLEVPISCDVTCSREWYGEELDL